MIMCECKVNVLTAALWKFYRVGGKMADVIFSFSEANVICVHVRTGGHAQEF
jgi:hypothetical protein